jgi:hypothetical protein
MAGEMNAYLSSKNKELDKAIDAHVAAGDELQPTVDLLTTMRGGGRILALTLITDLPELGQLDRRENQRVTNGGRGQVRKVACMATTSAIRAMIVTLNAMVRDDSPCNPNHPA